MSREEEKKIDTPCNFMIFNVGTYIFKDTQRRYSTALILKRMQRVQKKK